jgi:hypothetical protein
MIIANAINSPLPTSLALGGTNANLTASNGGIFYSTGSAGAILSGTATANQILLSGSSSAPAWSTTTYRATTTANELLYSSDTNIVGGLSTANSACLVSDAITFPVVIPYPVWSLPMSDGQIIIGGTSGRPEPANLIAGPGALITNGPGSVTINSRDGSNWKWISTQTASNSTELDFTNQIQTNYVAYRIIVKNLLPDTTGVNIGLRFGYFGGYISTNYYIYQQCCITSAGANNFYHGYQGGGVDLVYLTLTNIHGISPDPTYGGVCGTIDLFVTPDQVAGGIARMSYQVDSVQQYVNTTSTFNLIDPYYFNSVQLFTVGSYNLVSGSATLYGLDTMV